MSYVDVYLVFSGYQKRHILIILWRSDMNNYLVFKASYQSLAFSLCMGNEGALWI